MNKLSAALLLAGLLISPVQAETVTYLHTDLLGSVVLETDQNRNVVKRYEYEPYGLPRQAIADQLGYTGHLHDAGSGLVYMQQRYYDPEVGRFLSVDPMPSDTATGWNFNRYNYAANNPYTFVDPDGRMVGKPWEEPWGGRDPWGGIPDPLSGPDNPCGRGYLCLSGGGGQTDLYPDESDVADTLETINLIEATADLLSAAGMVFDVVTGPSGESVAIIGAIRVGANKAIRGAFERQLQQHGSRSLQRSQRHITRRLDEHLKKIDEIRASGGRTSSLEREVRTFRRQLKELEKLLGGL